MPVEELEEYFDIEIERDKFDTVGGLIFHLTGKIPATGDIVEGAGLQLTILDADERKIKKVCIARIGAVTDAKRRMTNDRSPAAGRLTATFRSPGAVWQSPPAS